MTDNKSSTTTTFTRGFSTALWSKHATRTSPRSFLFNQRRLQQYSMTVPTTTTSRFFTFINQVVNEITLPLMNQATDHQLSPIHILSVNNISNNNSNIGGTSSGNNNRNENNNNNNNRNNNNKDDDDKKVTNYFDYEQNFHYDYDHYTPTRKFFQRVGHVFFGYLCKAWMKAFHKITFVNSEEFEELVWSNYVNRIRGQHTGEPVPGCLTVLNHMSMMDEPFLVANLMPSKWFRTPEVIRSPICAKDQCFSNVVLAEMAKTLKILPIERGGSIDQKAMQIIINKLSTGHWVSMFPEGYIAQDGEVKKVRRGVGKIILESNPTPRVYPIYHRGMEGVKSEKKWLPSVGSHIVVKLGKEIHFDDIISTYKEGRISTEEAYIQIASRIEQKMKSLKLEVDDYRRIHHIRNKCEDEVV